MNAYGVSGDIGGSFEHTVYVSSYKGYRPRDIFTSVMIRVISKEPDIDSQLAVNNCYCPLGDGAIVKASTLAAMRKFQRAEAWLLGIIDEGIDKANNGGGRTTKNHAQRGTAGSAKAAPAKTGSAVAKTGLAVAKTGSAVAMTGSAAASTWNVFSVLADGDAGEDNGWT